MDVMGRIYFRANRAEYHGEFVFLYFFTKYGLARARIITKSINIDDYKNARACAYLYCESVG